MGSAYDEIYKKYQEAIKKLNLGQKRFVRKVKRPGTAPSEYTEESYYIDASMASQSQIIGN